MTTQPELFDARAAQAAKRDALERMEEPHGDWLAEARAVARDIARQRGTVTADDVRAVLYPRGMKPRHHNAWGALFQSREFVWTGKWRKSAVPQGHGNLQRTWRLASAGGTT